MIHAAPDKYWYAELQFNNYVGILGKKMSSHRWLVVRDIDLTHTSNILESNRALFGWNLPSDIDL